MVMTVLMIGEGEGDRVYLAVGRLPGVDRGWREELVVRLCGVSTVNELGFVILA